MNFTTQQTNAAETARREFLILACASIAALGATFAISALQIGFIAKAMVFTSVSGAYLLFCFLFFYKPQKNAATPEIPKTENRKVEPSAADFSAEAREKLSALEEASLVFGSALKPADMFRLVANRVTEIVSFQTMVLFLAGDGDLRASQAFGKHATEFTGNPAETARGIARRAFEKGETIVDAQLSLENLYLSLNAAQDFKSAAAFPLWRGGETYGVLALYGAAEGVFDGKAVRLLEAAAERVSPLFLSSMAFEANLNSALTDSLTGLPNERALFLVLENQIAEAQRNREGRALTVLTMDIRDFDRLNKNHGHQTGDRVLSFVAGKIKAQLRQMDFLSRAAGDEFLAVLPTASDEIAEAVVARIEKTFASEFFQTAGKRINVELNFGAASFIKDAETASELLKVARLRKNDGKSPIKGSILQFPERFSN